MLPGDKAISYDSLKEKMNTFQTSNLVLQDHEQKYRDNGIMLA